VLDQKQNIDSMQMMHMQIQSQYLAQAQAQNVELLNCKRQLTYIIDSFKHLHMNDPAVMKTLAEAQSILNSNDIYSCANQVQVGWHDPAHN
jgi:hypothetical protein